MSGSLDGLLPPALQDAATQAYELIAQGYRKVSSKHAIVSRIDRPDWKDRMARQGHPVHDEHPGRLEDQYRRVFTADKLQVSREVLVRIPSSGFAITGYCPKPGDPDPVPPKPNRMIFRGALDATLHDGPATLTKGTEVEVASRYADSLPGSRGEVAGWKWISGKGTPYVRVYFGENAGGDKMFKLFPASSLRVVSDAPIHEPAQSNRVRI